MKAALVVGADGAIGSVLLETVRRNGWRALGTTRRELGSQELIRLDLAQRPPDLRSDPKIATMLEECQFTAFLLAAVTSYGRCEDDRNGSRRVNVDHTLAIAEQLIAAGAFTVFASSNAVFGDSTRACTENDVRQPTSEYGRQKADAEAGLMRLIADAIAPAGGAILRLTKVVTTRGLIGEWICRLVKGQSIAAATDMMLSPVSARCAVRAMITIADQRQSGIYHLSGEREVSYHAFALELARALGKDPSQVCTTLVRDTLGTRISNSGNLAMGKVSRHAGLRPQRLSSAISDLMNDFQGAN